MQKKTRGFWVRIVAPIGLALAALGLASSASAPAPSSPTATAPATPAAATKISKPAVGAPTVVQVGAERMTPAQAAQTSAEFGTAAHRACVALTPSGDIPRDTAQRRILADAIIEIRRTPTGQYQLTLAQQHGIAACIDSRMDATGQWRARDGYIALSDNRATAEWAAREGRFSEDQAFEANIIHTLFHEMKHMEDDLVHHIFPIAGKLYNMPVHDVVGLPPDQRGDYKYIDANQLLRLNRLIEAVAESTAARGVHELCQAGNCVPKRVSLFTTQNDGHIRAYFVALDENPANYSNGVAQGRVIEVWLNGRWMVHEYDKSLRQFEATIKRQLPGRISDEEFAARMNAIMTDPVTKANFLLAISEHPNSAGILASLKPEVRRWAEEVIAVQQGRNNTANAAPESSWLATNTQQNVPARVAPTVQGKAAPAAPTTPKAPQLRFG